MSSMLGGGNLLEVVTGQPVVWMAGGGKVECTMLVCLPPTSC